MTEGPARSGGGCEFSKDSHLTLDMEDRVRLEVAVAGGKEIHSWAGANGFDSRSIYEMVSTGPKSTGAFGTVLVDIFENPGAHYTFAGRKNDGSRSLFEFAFEVSLESSHYSTRAGNEWRKTAYHGIFESINRINNDKINQSIDAATAELARVSLETAKLAEDTQMCRIRNITDYHYAAIGNGQFLIPRKSEFDTVSPNASETRSVTTFSACHEYTAESSLVFDGQAPAVAVNAATKAATPLQPGLLLTLALTAPIDIGSAAAGMPFRPELPRRFGRLGRTKLWLSPARLRAAGSLKCSIGIIPRSFSIRSATRRSNRMAWRPPLAIELEREFKVEKARTANGFGSRGTEVSPVACRDNGRNRAAGSQYQRPAVAMSYRRISNRNGSQ